MKLIKDLLIAFKEITIDYVKSRIFPVTALILILFSLLIGRLFKLQIKDGKSYDKDFTVSTEKTLKLNSIRGNIYDANGNLLAYNKISYTLTFGNSSYLTQKAKELGISENELKNRIIKDTINILQKNGDSIDVNFEISYKNGKYGFRVEDQALLNFLRDVYEKSYASELTEEQKKSSPEDVVNYLKKLFDIDTNLDDEVAFEILKCRYKLWLNRFQQYVPVEIAHQISEKSKSSIEENTDNLLGMDINVESVRVYNDAKYFAHIIGYVGDISQDELVDLNKNKGKNDYTYSIDAVVGKTGVEKSFEEYLHGNDGKQVLNVDNLGKVLSVKSETPATAGNNVYLTIDSDLQKYCYDMLERELAAIIIGKLEEYKNPDEDNKNDMSISIYDVYSAFFQNNLIKLDKMKEEDATDLEKKTYQNFEATRQATLNQMKVLLTTNPMILKELSPSYQDYSEYVCELLANKGIYDTSKVNQLSKTFLDYTNGDSSLKSFLEYLISIKAIDITSIEADQKYYDSDDIYDTLCNYIIEYLPKDQDFNDRIIKNMISEEGTISGNDCIFLLYDQGVLNKNGDQDYDNFRTGKINAYNFVITKLRNLDITPAMLNLTPCSGSIIVTDVETGAVKAMVTYPSYDNNKLTNNVDPDYYAKLLEDNTNPLFNRATMMQTAPGSTFKVVSTVAGVNNGELGVDERIIDQGIFDRVYTQPQCWFFREYKMKHGSVDISHALDVSCNYFFYEVGYRLATQNHVYDDNLGLSLLKKSADSFGLTQKSGVEIDEVEPHFSDNDAVTSAIGQGTHSYAPVQLAKYDTSIANSGTTYNLSLLDKVTDYQGNTIKEPEHKVTAKVETDPALWDKIHTGMRLVVTDDLKDNKFLNSLSVNVAGKTGTAQVGEDVPANALFISYAPAEKPETAVTVVIPNGYTSANAAYVAAYVYAYMYDKEALTNTNITSSTSSSVGD